jgi:hypothetical protein
MERGVVESPMDSSAVSGRFGDVWIRQAKEKASCVGSC